MADNQYELNLGRVRGTDGFSPVIEENPRNTADDYRLDIATAQGEFTTPNLMGAGGSGTGGGGMTEEQFNEMVLKLDAIKAVVDEHTTRLDEILQGIPGGAHGVVVSNDWTVVENSGVTVKAPIYDLTSSATGTAAMRAIQLGVNVEKDTTIKAFVSVGAGAGLYVVLNGEQIYTKTTASGTTVSRAEVVLELKQGVNSLVLSGSTSTTSYAYNIIVELPSLLS